MKKKDFKKNKKNVLVPYSSLAPGIEAVYTGKKRKNAQEEVQIITTVSSDDQGREIRKWPVFSWTWPGEEKNWDKDIRYINTLQSKLGILDNNTRQIRAHIASLVPCDSGFPVTVDELLNAIGKGKLEEPTFHNGCWCAGMWWRQKTTQPLQNASMKVIQRVLKAYLAGDIQKQLVKEFPYAKQFIHHTYKWFGPLSKFSDYQRLMVKRVLLTIELFVKSNYIRSQFSDIEKLKKNELAVKSMFEDGGKGSRLDDEISAIAGLPRIHPRWNTEYRRTLTQIKDRKKRELYRTCCAIASGVYTLSDCHHNTFYYIEKWIHGIGTGQLTIPTHKSGSEKKRLGQLLFGYVLGLDKWLSGVPMHFLLLELGHVDIGFNPKNEILRVYAYLGETRTAVKIWLAACLWHNLMTSPIGGNPGGLVRHKNLLDRASKYNISFRQWLDSYPVNQVNSV